ncbi:MAG: pentapeptide repeat-containing protein, partial [Deltaproteobacteria bacterium]|nr:pentapeptide repeat-containing protein [Deltaproteobacteria bacterium]
DLRGVDFSGADLTLARLEGADLTGADLTGANLFLVRLDGANLTDAKLDGADVRKASFKGAKLQGTLLQKTAEGPGGGGSKLFGTLLIAGALAYAQTSRADTVVKNPPVSWSEREAGPAFLDPVIASGMNRNPLATGLGLYSGGMATPWCSPLAPLVNLSVLPASISAAAMAFSPVAVPVGGVPAFAPVPVFL